MKLQEPNYSCLYCKKPTNSFSCPCVKKRTFWKGFRGEKKNERTRSKKKD